jgi:hypothetical protein
MRSRNLTVGIWVPADIMQEIDRRRGPFSRSAYLRLLLNEALSRDEMIGVIHLSKIRRERLAGDKMEPSRDV